MRQRRRPPAREGADASIGVRDSGRARRRHASAARSVGGRRILPCAAGRRRRAVARTLGCRGDRHGRSGRLSLSGERTCGRLASVRLRARHVHRHRGSFRPRADRGGTKNRSEIDARRWRKDGGLNARAVASEGIAAVGAGRADGHPPCCGGAFHQELCSAHPRPRRIRSRRARLDVRVAERRPISVGSAEDCVCGGAPSARAAHPRHRTGSGRHKLAAQQRSRHQVRGRAIRAAAARRRSRRQSSERRRRATFSTPWHSPDPGPRLHVIGYGRRAAGGDRQRSARRAAPSQARARSAGRSRFCPGSAAPGPAVPAR